MPTGTPLEERVVSGLGGVVGWFGIRAEDFDGVWGDHIDAAGVSLLSNGSGSSLEALTGERVDPDRYDLDLDPRPVADRLVNDVLAVGRRGPLVLYRPSWRLEEACTAFGVRLLSMPVAVQRKLEDKGAVEAALRRCGVPTLGWFDPALETPTGPAPFVTRRAGQIGGGQGMALIGELDELLASAERPGLVSASPFVADGLGVNVSGCCHANGLVTVHLPSVQLIGTPGCTQHTFGYCGNDTSAIADLPAATTTSVDVLTRRVGHWLVAAVGWRGAFGIDLVVSGTDARFCELNPRFQGSSRMTATTARASGRPGLFIEHVAAHLGVEPGSEDALGAPDPATEAQVVVHNLSERDVRRVTALDLPKNWSAELVPDRAVLVGPGAPLARLRTLGRVTSDGRRLHAEARSVVDRVRSAFAQVGTP